MRSVFIFLSVVAIFRISMAINCYQCLGGLTSHCHLGIETSMITLACDFLYKRHKNASTPVILQAKSAISKCVTFVVTLNKQLFIERGCGWVPKTGDVCDFVMKKAKNIQQCSSCETDFCNVDMLMG